VFVLRHQRQVIKYQLNLQKLKEDQQKLLLRAAIESEEKERKRLAGDLHDEVGASLLTVRLYILQAVKDQASGSQEKIMNAAKALLDEITGTVRQISHRLSPELLMKLGLKDTLQAMIQKLEASGTLKVSFSSPDNLPRMQPERELAVYRIVQEVLNNILKHAGASQMALHLITHGHFLIVSMENDGAGFDQPTFEALKNSPGGLGLKNIQNRVNILNASINFEKRKSGKGGMLMTLKVPLA
jgi:signal transduction histidine kinase